MTKNPASSLAIDIALLAEEPVSAAHPVLRHLPGWEQARPEDLRVAQLSGAMTNLVYRVARIHEGRDEEVVLLRVHASASDLFDREEEVDTFRAVSDSGLGPRLLLLFGNGRVEEFLLRYVTLGAPDLRDPLVSGAIAASMAQFHHQLTRRLLWRAPPGGRAQVWERLLSWLALCRELYPASEWERLGLGTLAADLAPLEHLLGSQHPAWLALCHNDLQYGNVMVQPLGAAGGEGEGAHLQDAGGAPPSQASATAQALAQLRLGASPALLPRAAAQGQLEVCGGVTVAAPRALASSGSEVSLVVDHWGRYPSGLQRNPSSSSRHSDGSFLLPGIRTRLRGQSPERKRPEAGSSVILKRSAEGAAGSVSSAGPAAAPASTGDVGSARVRLVLSAGNLLALGAHQAGAAAAGAGSRHPSLPGAPGANDDSSEDSDDLVASGAPPAPAAGEQRAEDAVALRAGANAYHRLRRRRQTPPEGIVFPRYAGSVQGDSSSELDSDDGRGAGDSAVSPVASAVSAVSSAASSPSAPRRGAAARAHDVCDAGAAAAAGEGCAAALAPSMRLIDYEYSGFNPVAFDLANHWCEWAADYHSAAPHELDFGLMPSDEQQAAFVQQYAAALLEAAGVAVTCDPAAQPPGLGGGGDSSAGQPDTLPSLDAWLVPFCNAGKAGAPRGINMQGMARLVAELHAAARAYVCVSHAMWALWGWIQAQVSDVDFDFVAYAKQRWQQYLLTRPPQLG